MSVKDHEESFGTHQFARELSLWSLSYRSSKIDTGRQGGDCGSVGLTSKHRTGVRATIPAVQVRGECSCGAGRGSLSARLETHGWPE